MPKKKVHMKDKHHDKDAKHDKKHHDKHDDKKDVAMKSKIAKGK